MPQGHQCKPSKLDPLADTLVRKLVDNPADKVPHPFPSLFHMTSGSISLSDRGLGDVSVHTDTTTHPHIFLPSEFAAVESHISTFVAPPQYRLNIPAETALEEAKEVLGRGSAQLWGGTRPRQHQPTAQSPRARRARNAAAIFQ